MRRGWNFADGTICPVPGAAELDRLRWTAVAFWALALALVAAVELGEFL